MSKELDRALDNAIQSAVVPQPTTGEVTLMQKGVEKLRQHAELQVMAGQYADFITQTGQCPDIYRNKPLDAAAAIIRGTALGFDPDGALEAFFVIKGKTGMYARAMVAVAENAGCKLWEVEATDKKVVWEGVRPGVDKVERVEWSIQRAETAGYTTNARYKTNPQEMLRSKCQAELARMLAPGALMGLYSEGEPDAFQTRTVSAAATRTDNRGMDAVRAALEKKNAEQPPHPMDVEEVDEDALAGVQEALAGFSTQQEVTEFMKNLGEVPAYIRDAGKARWEELKAGK